jgi:hypothetical protein
MSPTYTEAAQGTLDGVAGAGVDVEVSCAGGLLDGNQDSDAGALVSRIARAGRPAASGVVQSRNHRSPSTACQKQVRAWLPPGCPAPVALG